MEDLLSFLTNLKLQQPKTPPPPTVLKELTIEDVARVIKEGLCKKIIVMAGAGISVAAGIPDFRSPGTGLYDNLARYNLPRPEAVFEIDFFKENPKPFYELARELYPGQFIPTYVHFFIRLLAEKGVLLRCYTQNIDTLERLTGLDGDKIVEAHGSFASAHCIECDAEYSQEFIKTAVFETKEIPHCTKCNGLVKPRIVFFGESLPDRFHNCLRVDFPQCDLLIVIGTSLVVQPFASLISKVKADVPRVLINREISGQASPLDILLGGGGGFSFGETHNYRIVRDIACLGDCQEKTKELAELLGWGNDLQQLVDNFDKSNKGHEHQPTIIDSEQERAAENLEHEERQKEQQKQENEKKQESLPEKPEENK